MYNGKLEGSAHDEEETIGPALVGRATRNAQQKTSAHATPHDTTKKSYIYRAVQTIVMSVTDWLIRQLPKLHIVRKRVWWWWWAVSSAIHTWGDSPNGTASSRRGFREWVCYVDWWRLMGWTSVCARKRVANSECGACVCACGGFFNSAARLDFSTWQKLFSTDELKWVHEGGAGLV